MNSTADRMIRARMDQLDPAMWAVAYPNLIALGDAQLHPLTAPASRVRALVHAGAYYRVALVVAADRRLNPRKARNRLTDVLGELQMEVQALRDLDPQ